VNRSGDELIDREKWRRGGGNVGWRQEKAQFEASPIASTQFRHSVGAKLGGVKTPCFNSISCVSHLHLHGRKFIDI